MAKFGGNDFSSFSVPLVFEGRYFVFEPGNPSLLSVFLIRNGQPVIELLNNEGNKNFISEVWSNTTGVVTVTDKTSGELLYKVHPGSQVNITFGTFKGDEITVKVSDRSIEAGGVTFANKRFNGMGASVAIARDGSVKIGVEIPPEVLSLLQ